MELKPKFINCMEVSSCLCAHYCWNSVICWNVGEWNYSVILS